MDMSISRGEWKGRIGLLAQRELECLLGVACGFTSKEIAKLDGCSPATVDKRLLSASYKLQVFKRAQLVAEAMRRGLIASFSSYPSATAFNGECLQRATDHLNTELRQLKAREETSKAA